MSLILRGKEFIATDALGARDLAGLSALAARRPLVLNGVLLSAEELAELAAEARRTQSAVWVGPRHQPEQSS